MPQKQQNKTVAVPFTVDLISDLNLKSADDFTWEGKSTSLFCAVAGNLASDLSVLEQALSVLSKCYRGVLFIDGSLEHPDVFDYENRVDEIKKICKRVENVIYLHNHVVILNNVAFIAINGWYGNKHDFSSLEEIELCNEFRDIDISYLTSGIKSLQLHREAKRIVVISNSMPSKHLAFGDPNLEIPEALEPIMSLYPDTEEKVGLWMFGGYLNLIDQNLQNRRYVNNPHMIQGVYQPKRIML